MSENGCSLHIFLTVLKSCNTTHHMINVEFISLPKEEEHEHYCIALRLLVIMDRSRKLVHLLKK